MAHDFSTPRFGAWVTLDSTVQIEQISRIGFDFVCIDGQHGVLDYGQMRDALIAVTAAHGPIPIARVSSNNPSEIGRMLDAGAHGIIVPMIETAEDARIAAKAARYPSSGGLRSYSPVRQGDHFGSVPAETDDKIFILAMIETSNSLAEVDEILDVPGIDGIFVGPYDLSLGLGATVPFEESILPTLEAALQKVCDAARSRGKIAGIYAGTGEDAVRRAKQGFNLVNTTHDMRVIREGMSAELNAARTGIGQN